MNNFGLNVSMRDLPSTILDLGEKCFGSGLFSAIEVTYCDNLMGVDSVEYNEAIRTIVRKYSPRVLVHIMDYNTSDECVSIRSAIIHEFTNCCRYVKSLGGHEIIMHAGSVLHGQYSPLRTPMVVDKSGEMMYKRAFELSVEMFKTCSAIAKQHGIHIYTENLSNETICCTTEQLTNFVKAVNMENVSIVYDVGHANRCGLDIPTSIKECGSLLNHTHIHDNFGSNDDHLPVGNGTIDFPAFFKALNEISYSGIYMFEVFPSTAENFILSHKRSLEYLQRN